MGKPHETGTFNPNDSTETKANHIRPTRDSQQTEMTRRQFVAASGALLGTVAVGGFVITEAQAADAGKGSATKLATNQGPWDPALEKLREWDPKWAETCVKMTTNPWTGGVLPRKTVELISVALNAACTNLNPEGTRRHIRAALEAGATRDEILMVLKCASVMSIHSCSLGAPIRLEEAKAAGVQLAPRKIKAETPACDKMREIGQWNQAWDPFYELDPAWTDEFFATALGIYASEVLTPKEVELLSIAFDASYTHMYAPGTRRHIKAALKLGATLEEIMEVLKLCVVQGVQACNLGVPILAQEMAKRSAKGNPEKKRTRP
ncbi:MAG TPA: carboxymuconolactone decarboxylase family protein [Anaerolineales bacterium]|nr:carboxymuconolactone decarboxylase family protein [Anaerolineales bacterium]